LRCNGPLSRSVPGPVRSGKARRASVSSRTATLTGVPVGAAKTYTMTFSATLGGAATTQKLTLTTG
jgi:hypothetical protein